jgi:DNA adenine methylase
VEVDRFEGVREVARRKYSLPDAAPARPGEGLEMAVDGLAAVSERLRPVVIEDMDALTLIKREDSPTTLQYLDPPYLHDTRASKDLYAFEMTREEHVELLSLLTDPSLKGKFMLSGYRNDLYDGALIGWTRHEFDLPNHQAGGDEKRRMIECVWCNF